MQIRSTSLALLVTASVVLAACSSESSSAAWRVGASCRDLGARTVCSDGAAVGLACENGVLAQLVDCGSRACSPSTYTSVRCGAAGVPSDGVPYAKSGAACDVTPPAPFQPDRSACTSDETTRLVCVGGVWKADATCAGGGRCGGLSIDGSATQGFCLVDGQPAAAEGDACASGANDPVCALDGGKVLACTRSARTAIKTCAPGTRCKVSGATLDCLP